MRKKLKFIGTDTVIAAIFILALLNFSYVQNNKNSISRILNMKFQIISDQNGNKQEEVPKEREGISGARSEKATVTEQKEDSYVKKSYLVAKAENGTLYVKNMLPDTGFSEEEIIETAEIFHFLIAGSFCFRSIMDLSGMENYRKNNYTLRGSRPFAERVCTVCRT